MVLARRRHRVQEPWITAWGVLILGLTSSSGAFAQPDEARFIDRLCDRLEPSSPVRKGFFCVAETAIRERLGLWPRHAARRSEQPRKADRDLFESGARRERGLLEAFDASGSVLCSVDVKNPAADRSYRNDRLSSGAIVAAADQLVQQIKDNQQVACVRLTHTHPSPPAPPKARSSLPRLDKHLGPRLRNVLALASLNNVPVPSSFSWEDKRLSHRLRNNLALAGLWNVSVEMGLLYEADGQLNKRLMAIPAKGSPIEAPPPLP